MDFGFEKGGFIKLTAKIILLILLIATTTGCVGGSLFPPIGTNMANPLFISLDEGSDRLYVLNSNYKIVYASGSIHIVDIETITDPTRLHYDEMPDFNGQIYPDPTNNYLYTPTRWHALQDGATDGLLRFNINEASASLLDYNNYPSDSYPFGVAHYAAENWLLVVSREGYLDWYDLDDATPTKNRLSLTVDLSDGTGVTGYNALRVAIYGTQAVIARDGEGLWIVNLSELGVAGKYPIDYYIEDITHPQGIAGDGTYIYVADTEWPSNVETPQVLVLDISSLPPRTDNTTALVVDKDDAGIVFQTIDLDTKDPTELVLGNDNIYVSHFGYNKVSISSLTTYLQTDIVDVSSEPYGMDVYINAGTDQYLFVANSGANTISIVDIAAGTIAGTYP